MVFVGIFLRDDENIAGMQKSNSLLRQQKLSQARNGNASLNCAILTQNRSKQAVM